MNTGGSPMIGNNVFDTSSNAYTSGVRGMGFAMNPMAVPATMNQFLSPYLTQVVDDTVGRLRDRRDLDLNMVRGQAAQSGAFGGARQGLVEANLIEDYGRQEDETVARLLQSGFDSSAGLALDRIGQVAGIGSSMVGAAPVGFDLGERALNRQAQAGAQQRGMAQQLLDLASRQFGGFANYPQSSLNTALSGIMGNPLAAAGTTTGSQGVTRQPGLFDYLSLASGTFTAGK